MSVTLLIPGVLRGEVDGASRLSVPGELSPGTDTLTLAAVLDEVRVRWPRLERRLRDERAVLRRYVNVYVNGEDCRGQDGQAMVVPQGAEIQILPSVAGG